MNTIKLLVMVILFLTINLNVYGKCDDNYDDETEESAPLYPIHNETEKKRHEKPGRGMIRCMYTSHYIRFIMPPHIHTLQVSIGGEDDPEWQGWIDSSYPKADIPTLYGDYEIVCRTPNNQVFKGNLQFAN